MSTNLRFGLGWQRVWCATCRDEMNHYKSRCVHCGGLAGAASAQPVPAYNGRVITASLTEEQRARARRLLMDGMSARIVAASFGVSKATIYRMSPFTRDWASG